MSSLSLVAGTSPEIIRVDRSIVPPYPHWAWGIVNPGIEKEGPEEYDPSGIEIWFHDGQMDHPVSCMEIYDYLDKKGALVDCLGLADLQAIRGRRLFSKFPGKRIQGGYALRSAVVSNVGGLWMVPFLSAKKDDIDWEWMGFSLHSECPILRFPKMAKVV